MVILKSDSDISKIRRSGKVVAKALRVMGEAINPGKTSTADLDLIAETILAECGAKPSFKGYHGYPAATCISVNDVVVHGIPDGKILKDGDIVGIDIGANIDGWHADGAWTYSVGSVSIETQRLMDITLESLHKGISKAKINNTTGDIGSTIQKFVEENGYSVVRDLAGHGIGRDIHEAPSLPNFGKAGKGDKLKVGMTICIEPMVNEGVWQVNMLNDGWTIVTKDGKLSAHYEHTVAITQLGTVILTTESD